MNSSKRTVSSPHIIKPAAIMNFIVYFLTAAFTSIIIFFNIEKAFNNSLGENLTAFAAFAAITAVIVLIYKIEISTKKLAALITILAFCVRLAYILLVENEPKSDFAILFEASKGIVSNDLGFLDSSYFKRWAYQVPFVLFQSLFLFIYNSVFTLKVVNVLMMTGICYFIYSIGKKMGSGKSGAVISLLYAIYPYSFITSNILTNQHSSTFFLLLGLNILMSCKKKYMLIISALAFAVGYLLRPDSLITVIALICVAAYRLIDFLASKNKEKLQQFLFAGASTIAAIFFIWLITAIMTLTVFGKNGLGNNRPEWKFVLGFNTESMGTYAETDSNILTIENDEEREAKSEKIIKAYLKDANILQFFSEKVKIFWSSGDQYHWSVQDKSLSSAVFILRSVEEGLYLLILLLFLSSAILSLVKNEGSLGILISDISFIGIFIIYLFIEIQPRYRYIAMPFIFISASYSLSFIESKLKSKKQENEYSLKEKQPSAHLGDAAQQAHKQE